MALEKVTLTGASESLNAGFTKVNDNIDYSLEGDGTTRVLRCMRVTIQDGTTASTIKVKAESIFNGDAIAEENNLAKNGDTGYFNLDSDGNEIHIESGAFAANVSHVIMAQVYRNAGGNFPYAEVTAVSNGLTLAFKHNDDSVYDLTSHTDTGNLYIHILYLSIQA